MDYKITIDKFEGPFSNTSFEAVLVGIAENLDALQDKDVLRMIKAVYTQDKFKEYAERGTRVINRFRGLNEFSREYFSNAN